MMPKECGCDPKACSMDGSSDRGEDTSVEYDIATAPSAVYDIAGVFCVDVVIATSTGCSLRFLENSEN